MRYPLSSSIQHLPSTAKNLTQQAFQLCLLARQSINLMHSLKNISLTLLCLLTLSACSADSGNNEQQTYGPSIPAGLDEQAEQKFKQYWVQGRILYKKHCIGCHQDDGSGLAQLIPPLAGADYLKRNTEQVICIIRHGQQGPIVVNGVEYNGVMPANPGLKALDVAEISTYILNAWGNKGEFVSVQQAEAALKSCKQSSN